MALRSSRTLIRAWQRHDEELVAEWPPYHDPLEPLWNLPRQSSSDWYSGFDFGSSRRTWAVEDLSGHLMGRISLREVDEKVGRARLGITFGAPYVGQGFGTEALATFLDYYFSQLGFATMVLDVAAPNERAVRSYERLGFEHVGTDWRATTSAFDRRILREARYAALRRFFREENNRLWVLFYEMELAKQSWQARRQQHARRNGG